MLDPLKFQLDHHIADLEPRAVIPAAAVKDILFGGDSSKDISTSRKLENLYLVAMGIRPSSMFHPVSIEEILIVHEMAEELGLGMVVRKCGTQVHKVFIYGRGIEMIEIPDIFEDVGFRNFIIGQIAIAKMSGSFLGFPDCCVESFVGHLMQGTDQDLAATEALRLETDPDPNAYFVERFVPCNPGCIEAISIGQQILADLKVIDKELAGIYDNLKQEHIEEIRGGSILREKKERDRAVRRYQDDP